MNPRPRKYRVGVRRADKRQRGFVLLMALVLVLVAGVSLAGIAGRSMSSALQARSGVEELQRRWAAMSLRTTLAGQLEDVLQQAERGDALLAEAREKQKFEGVPTAERRFMVTLAEQNYELIVTDEQAKLNVNQLLEGNSSARLTSWLRKVRQRSRVGEVEAVTIRVRPMAEGLAGGESFKGLARLGAYGQLFAEASPGDLIGDEKGRGLVSDITCWGNGAVNARRATRRVVEEVCGELLTKRQMGELLEAVADQPFGTKAQWLKGVADLEDTTRQKLEGLLTDQSGVHGLWVVARGGQRDWYTLMVTVGGTAGVSEGSEMEKWRNAEQYEFAW